MDVGAWLRDLGLEQYEQVFVDNDIDAALLPRLTAEDLKELGVASIGHRRRLLDAISGLQFRSPAAEQPEPASAVPHEDPGERAPPVAG